MKTTYTKRAKGGYYATATDPDFFCIVERRYIFTLPDRGWWAMHRGKMVYGDTRKEAVELLAKSFDKGRG